MGAQRSNLLDPPPAPPLLHNNLLAWTSPEPPVGTRVARYGYVYERTDGGWQKVGLMVKTNVPRIWPKRRGRAIAWADLFFVDGGSDFVVDLSTP